MSRWSSPAKSNMASSRSESRLPKPSLPAGLSLGDLGIKPDSPEASVGDYRQHLDGLARRALRVIPEERTAEEMHHIVRWIQRQSPNLRRFFSLCFHEHKDTEKTAAERRQHLTRHMKLLNVSSGTMLLKQGDVASSFYIILDGTCEVFHRPIVPGATLLPRSARSGGASFGAAGSKVDMAGDHGYLGISVGVLSEGECVGELSDRFGGIRSATIIAKTPGDSGKIQVLQIDQQSYEEAIHPIFRSVDRFVLRIRDVLSRLYLFNDWPEEELYFLAYWMTDAKFETGSTLFEQSDPSDNVYLILSGTVELSRTVKRDDPPLVVEWLTHPCVLGVVDAVRRFKTRQFSARAVGDEDTLVACLPISLFQKLVLSDLPRTQFQTATKLEDSAEDREAWHQLRISENDGSGIGYSLFETVQTRFLACSWCGEKGHSPRDCALVEGTATAMTAPMASHSMREGPRAALRSPAGSHSTGGVAWGEAPSLSASTTPQAGSGGSSSPAGTIRSQASGSPINKHLSRVGSRSPVGRRARVGSVTGEDWLGEDRSPIGGDEIRVREATSELTSIKKAVNAFKRLLHRAHVRDHASHEETAPVEDDDVAKSLQATPVTEDGGSDAEPEDDTVVGGSLFLRPKAARLRAMKSDRGPGKFAALSAHHRSLRQLERKAGSSSAAMRSGPFSGSTRSVHHTITASSRSLRGVTPSPKEGHPSLVTKSALTPARAIDPPVISHGVGGVRRVNSGTTGLTIQSNTTPSRILADAPMTASPKSRRAAANLSLELRTEALAHSPGFGSLGGNVGSQLGLPDALNPIGPAGSLSSPTLGTDSPSDSPSAGALRLSDREQKRLVPWRLDTPTGQLRSSMLSASHGSATDGSPSSVDGSPSSPGVSKLLPHRRRSLTGLDSPLPQRGASALGGDSDPSRLAADVEDDDETISAIARTTSMHSVSSDRDPDEEARPIRTRSNKSMHPFTSPLVNVRSVAP